MVPRSHLGHHHKTDLVGVVNGSPGEVEVVSGPVAPTAASPWPAAIAVAGLVTTWLASSMLLQHLETAYYRPCFLTWCIHSGYMVFVFLWLPLYYLSSGPGRPTLVWQRYGLSKSRMLWSIVGATLLSYLCAYTWFLSLPRTTIAASNAIYQSSTALVYVLSVVVLHEKASRAKSLAVALSIAGVVLVSLAPQRVTAPGIHPDAGGYLWLMVSVLLYAVFEVFQKKYMEPEEELGAPGGSTSVAHKVEVASFFLMCYGTLTFAALWVLVPGAHALGVEEFSPPDRGVVGSLVVNVLLDAAFNGFLVSGILIASPLVMSVGAMLVMPVSIVADGVANGTQLSASASLGALLIVAAFGVLALPVSPRKLPGALWRLLCGKGTAGKRTRGPSLAV